jgi:chromosomal replication initiation ATPase DnaA
MLERLGIVEERQATRKAVLANCRLSREARARILGGVVYRLPAKEHRIVVDIKAGTRTVETKDHAELMRPRPRAEIPEPRRLRNENAGILNAVAEAFNVTLYGLLSPLRDKVLSQARFAAMRLMREGGKSTTGVGKALKRDHTTAMHGLRQADKLLSTDREWANRYHDARERAKGGK